jgi:S-adenosylmethionine uptake transporter
MTSGVRGILFIIAGMAALATQDMVIKFLSGGYPLHQIVLSRACLALLLTLVLVRMEGGLRLLRTRRPALHLARGLLVTIANMTYFTAFASLPLAEATALFFVAPLFITLLSVPMLGETVGPRRWAAVIVGLAGVVVMTRPGSGLFNPIAILPVVAAFCYALSQMLTRRLGVTDRASVMSFYIHLTFFFVSAGAGLTIGSGDFLPAGAGASLSFLLRPWVWPEGVDAPLFLVCGVLVTIGGYCLAEAYRVAAAASVAPFEYVSLPMAVMWGYFVFHEAPDAYTFTGVALIAGGGLYVFYRESVTRHIVAAERPTPRNR